MIMTVITSDFKHKCGNCKYFETYNGIDGYCICDYNRIKDYNRFRFYNSKSCKAKEVKTIE